MFHPKPKYSIEDLLAVYWKLTMPSGDAKRVEEQPDELSDADDGEADSPADSGSLSQPGK